MRNHHCMNCRSPNLYRFLDLGNQPNGNHFPPPEAVEQEIIFPFSMMVCRTCWQVQIQEFPSPEFMFANHPYVTGVNMPVVDHFDALVKKTVERYQIPKNSLVIDIGCNDGTLLKKFQSAAMRVLGVDPGRLTGQLCRDGGISVCETFWNEQTAQSIRQLHLHPSLITATAVFYHVPDIHDFIRGLKEVMDEDTIFLAQCVNMGDVVEKCQFDHFYHEHTMMHSVGPLKRLFEEHGLRILDVEHYDIHGGSFVIYVGLNANQHSTTDRVAKWIEREKEQGLFTTKCFDDFTKKVEKNRTDLQSLLQTLKEQNRSVWALGAPLKGSTLLNYCEITPDLVQKAVEVNRFKIGKVTPGTHIPIESEVEQTSVPDYYLVLAWNFLDFFVKKYSHYLEQGGRFIVPNPEVTVIDKNGRVSV